LDYAHADLFWGSTQGLYLQKLEIVELLPHESLGPKTKVDDLQISLAFTTAPNQEDSRQNKSGKHKSTILLALLLPKNSKYTGASSRTHRCE
jgi:hypothetical protein